jgi:excisionase family DNA binding protein
MKTEVVKNSAVYESVDELAEELRISRQSAYKGLHSGEIPSIRVGKRFILSRFAISKWLQDAGRPSGGAA